MGIQGLLPLMKGAEINISLSKLQDTVAAIDTNGWIHRACYSCADRIFMGEPTEMFIYYCLNFCKILQKHRITPILVFDGQSLPAKSDTKLARQKRKQEKREEIQQLLRTGREREARWLMRQCVDVTFEMCRQVIECCRKENIDCLVAPFEADAQITYLVNNNLADYAITEDSDLLAFGCKRALYKLDRETERGRMVDISRLDRCFKNLDWKKFQLMCILSGCDYISNIPGVGIGRARKFFETLCENPTVENIPKILEKLPIVLKMQNKIHVTKDYIEDFIRASNTFDYQIVYSPQFDRLVYLNPLPKNVDPKEFANYGGHFFPNGNDQLENNLKFVTNYVLGNVCPKTLTILDLFTPYDDNSTIWYSSVFNERIKSHISSNHPNRKLITEQNNEEKLISIDENATLKVELKNNKKQIDIIEIIDDKPEPKTETKPKTIETTYQRRQLSRNVFRKRTFIDDGIIKKSKYFSDDQNGDSNSDTDLPETKKSRQESIEELNQSFSSIEEEDIQALKLLNNCQIDESIAIRQSSQRSYSLSSTQTSQSTSRSDSPVGSPIPSSVDILFNNSMTKSNKCTVSKKRNSRKSSSLSTKNTANNDIRKFFSQIP
ncbi:exonuclease tos [Dermatophagoides pteronyssinus]|uniref:exonuclease tos n=1 Tax=Dermatophagoides pteronyssinus TaxID=6956 RepID=UPI003F67C1FC